VRAYTYVDDLVEGVTMLMQADPARHPELVEGPGGMLAIIGGDEYITVDELVQMVIKASGKEIGIEHVEGPVGVASLRAGAEPFDELRTPLRQVQDQVAGLGGGDESSRGHRQDVSMD
jgi:nucleoside-diphosphate-sugar epimerase